MKMNDIGDVSGMTCALSSEVAQVGYNPAGTRC